MRASIKHIILMIVFYTASLVCADSVFIVIHGTWGLESEWYMPGGDFFDALECTVSTKNSAVVPFCWSGGAGHESRVKAAHNLAKLIATYDKHVAIYLVAHSHGGNVATLASQILSRDECNKHRIRGLYTLGTPIMSNYLPNMDVILYFYNLFSLEDLIQPALGVSAREFPVHKRIANMRVFIDGKQPGHTALHDAVVAQWLPLIHQQFKQYLRQKNVFNTIEEPSIIYFDHTKAPEFVHDTEREALISRDHQLSVLMINSLRKFLDTGSKMPLTNR
jgi:hypothetical protein